MIGRLILKISREENVASLKRNFHSKGFLTTRIPLHHTPRLMKFYRNSFKKFETQGRRRTRVRVFKAALSRDAWGREEGMSQVWASASDQTKQARRGREGGRVGRAFVRVYLSAAISRTLQIEWRLLDTRLIPLKTSNGQKLHQQPPSTLRGYRINLPCRHPRRTHTHTHTHIYPSDTRRTFARFTSLLCLRATFSPYRLVYTTRVYLPFLPRLSPLFPFILVEAARARAERTRSFFSPLPSSLPSLYRRPKENPFDDSSLATPPIPEISVIFRVTAAQGGGRSVEGVN